MFALGHHGGTGVLAALIGGDLGPRLFPMGSSRASSGAQMPRRSASCFRCGRFESSAPSPYARGVPRRALIGEHAGRLATGTKSKPTSVVYDGDVGRSRRARHPCDGGGGTPSRWRAARSARTGKNDSATVGDAGRRPPGRCECPQLLRDGGRHAALAALPDFDDRFDASEAQAGGSPSGVPDHATPGHRRQAVIAPGP